MSCKQLKECGLNKVAIGRLLTRGALAETLPGVYRVKGADETWHHQVMRATLWAGDGVASHNTAAALWGLDGFSQRGVHISTPKKRQLGKDSPRFQVHETSVPEHMVTVQRGLRVTIVARTLVDLATVSTADRYGRVVEDAMRRGLTSLDALSKFLNQEKRRARPGEVILRSWIEAGAFDEGPSASAFQRDLRALLKPIGGFREEVVIATPGGRFVARVDFGHEEVPLIVEGDSRKHHSGRDDWQHDLARRNRVTAQGYQVLHVTPGDIKTPEGRAAVGTLVRGAIAAARPLGAPPWLRTNPPSDR